MSIRLPFALLASSLLNGLLVSPLFAAETPSKANQPNILFILADDYGTNGVGCYGSDRFKGKTPNLDALATSGLRFDHCYSTPLCGPSRCLINTGRYAFRTGGLNNDTAGNPSYKDQPALATILKQAGYVTGTAGKWRQMGDTPGDWGYDETITDFRHAGGNKYWTKGFTKNGQEVTFDREVYYPDACVEFAIDFFRRHREQPCYFYLAQRLVHAPICARPTLSLRPTIVSCTTTTSPISTRVWASWWRQSRNSASASAR